MKNYKKFFNSLKGILSNQIIGYIDHTITDNNSDISDEDYEDIETGLKSIIANGITEYYLGDKLIKDLIELFRYGYNDLKEKEGEITI